MNIPGLQLNGSLDELPWRDTRDEGIQWIDLRRDMGGGPDSKAGGAGESGAAPGRAEDPSMTVLILMQPGRGYPRHKHLGAEDVLVLAGGYGDEDGRVFKAGDFVRYPAGSEHTPVALGEVGDPVGPSNPACVLFAVAHGGTEVSVKKELRP